MKILFKDFMRYEAIYEMYKDDQWAMQVQTIKIFKGKDARQSPMNEVLSDILEINKALAEEQPFTTRFIYNKIEYGLIPDFSNITTGELIDLDTLLDAGELEEVCKILYRPIISKTKNTYDIKPYDGKTELKDLEFKFVIQAIDFFAKSYHQLKKTSNTSIIKK